IEYILEAKLNMAYGGCHPFSVRIVFVDFFLAGLPRVLSSATAFLEFLVPILISYLLSYLFPIYSKTIPVIGKIRPVLSLFILFIAVTILSTITIAATRPEICSLY